MTVELSLEIAQLLVELLDQSADVFGNFGCDDHYLEDTPENRRIALEADRIVYEIEDPEIHLHNGYISTGTSILMEYIGEVLRDKIKGLEHEQESKETTEASKTQEN